MVPHRRPPGGPAGFQTSHSRCSPAESSYSCSCTPPELQKHGRGIQTCSAWLRNAPDILMTLNLMRVGVNDIDNHDPTRTNADRKREPTLAKLWDAPVAQDVDELCFIGPPLLLSCFIQVLGRTSEYTAHIWRSDPRSISETPSRASP